ncbi:WD40 repeat protein [Minicystis rosea]|nr:WD40 repeat protein [Minicystis rosea]
MDDEIIDFGDERSRHGQLFGRDDVLAKLRSWMIGERALARGWVLLLGGPGVGKSAIVNRVLEDLSPDRTPHHFIRRGNEGWDRPEVIVQNLCAQVERQFRVQADGNLSFEARLGELLRRLSRHVLVPQEQRLVMVLDGLDELASPGEGRKPTIGFLPRVLPSGVIVLCASRPTYPDLDWMDDRVRRINLDEVSFLASNEAACRAYWEHQAQHIHPPLEQAFIEEAIHRAGGNMLHATRLRDWLDEQPSERRAAMLIPIGLDGFLIRIWNELHDLGGRCAPW